MISRLYIFPTRVDQYYSTQLVPEDSNLQNKLQSDITDVDTFSSVHPHRQQLTFLVLQKAEKGGTRHWSFLFCSEDVQAGTVPQFQRTHCFRDLARQGELQNSLAQCIFFDNSGCTFLEHTQYNNSFLTVMHS